jgi:hypothetical protein
MVIMLTWFVSSFGIILNQDSAPYCLLVPSVGFLGVIVIAAEDLAWMIGGKWLRTVTLSALLAWYGGTFLWMASPGHALGVHVQACRKIAESHAKIRAHVVDETSGPFGFLLEGGNLRMRWLFFDKYEPSLMNFVLRREGEFTHFVAAPGSDRIASAPYVFRYDRAFNLREIRRGQQTLFEDPSGTESN